MDFKDIDTALKYLDNQIPNGLKQVGEKASHLLRDYILQTVYANPPTMYDRTYDFLNAITVSEPIKVGGWWQIKLYIDSDKIRPIAMDVGNGVWNKHMSMDGSDYSQYLAITLEEGANSPYYNTPAFHYMAMTQEQINRTQMHIKGLMNYFKSKGFNVMI